ncbi:hypothetical protein [Brevundimonas diminuta]|uniref:hypothetical protein n=1 Tax=Brevundimonas diminuta TaxID=293 RepID=UPI000E13D4A1|nr:hypothetical protein [Brevundimonas diminuta]WQE46687.1 hypothetical protein U0020_07530 [Brevundimonas diminuta]SUW15945.1 phosphoribosylpyrophosphate synthetase [Brevundimonas diminuta]
MFAEDSHERLKELTDRIVSSDSIPHDSNAIGLAPLIAAAIAAEGAQEGIIRRRRPPKPLDEVERAGVDSFPGGVD